MFLGAVNLPHFWIYMRIVGRLVPIREIVFVVVGVTVPTTGSLTIAPF